MHVADVMRRRAPIAMPEDLPVAADLVDPGEIELGEQQLRHVQGAERDDAVVRKAAIARRASQPYRLLARSRSALRKCSPKGTST